MIFFWGGGGFGGGNDVYKIYLIWENSLVQTDAYNSVNINAGIISAMAFSPFPSGMLALGSYNQTTAIYREDNMELLYFLHGQEGGITHVS